MKIAKIIFSSITIVIGALGIVKLLPYSVSQAIAFTSLAILLVLCGQGYRERGDKGSAYTVYALALIVMLVTVYNIIF